MPFKLFRTLFGGSQNNSKPATRKAQRSRIRKHLLEQLEDRRVFAAEIITNVAYTQNFDTLLATSPTADITGGEFTAAMNGWYFLESGSSANLRYSAGTGSGTAGDTYSFGATSATDRALGGLLSGSVNPTVGAQFQNGNAATITELAIAYVGEQWRLGTTGRADRLDFQYSVNATSLNTGTWIDVDALDFSSPVTTGATGALVGNTAANRTSIVSSITGLNIAPNATFWIRWSDFNASGADDGLAVDEFSITATAGGDTTSPTVTSFDDGDADDIVVVGQTLNYTVTFNEDINATSVTDVDFNNAGTSSITIGAITEPAPGVFTVPVTASTAGTLILRIPTGAVIQDVAGNALVVPVQDDTTVQVTAADVTPPTVTSITDDEADDLMAVGALVTYTVTFSEDINETTVAAADFDNAGTAGFSIGTINETSPGVFTVPVTATSAGTLQLRIPTGAVILDTANNPLGVPVSDVETINVDGTAPLVSSITDNLGGGSGFVNSQITYTVTFNEDIAGTSVTAADFDSTGTATYTIGAVTETSPGVVRVLVTPTSVGTVILRIHSGAVITDIVGNALTVPISDDNSITVITSTLATGDIAFVGYNADGNDDFAFVALAAIAAGERIVFTDNEWNGTAFTTGEGEVIWTSPTGGVPAGTVIQINNAALTASISASTGTVSRSGSFDLGASGEGLFAITGSQATPTVFISAIANEGTAGFTTLSGTGLATGVNAVDFASTSLANHDIFVYTGARTTRGTFGAYRTLINSPANWISQDGSGDQSNDGTAPDVPFDLTTFSLATQSSVIYINEVLFDAVAATDTSEEFIELRGTPNTIVPEDAYLVLIDGDSEDTAGNIDHVFYIAGMQFGSAGYLVLRQFGSTYTTGANASVFTATATGWGASWSSRDTDIENGAVSVLVIQTNTAPVPDTDVDSDNNGTLDSAAATWTVKDALGNIDGGANDTAYGFFNTSGNGQGSVPAGSTFINLNGYHPDYAARIGDSTGATGSDWVVGELAGSMPNISLATGGFTLPSSFEGVSLNSLGGTNPSTLTTPVLTVTAPNAVYTGVAYAGASVNITGAASPTPTASFTYYVGTGTGGTNLGSSAPINVGTYTVVATTPANSANNAATSSPVTFQITPKSLTPTATAANKTYDGNTAAVVTVSLSGVISGQTVTGSASGTFDTKNVGTGKTVTVGVITLGGADASNYSVGTAANTTANITAKSLTPTATAANKTYDGNTTAVVTVSLGGVVSGETVTGSASGTFDTKNVGTGKTVTVGAVTLGGADAGNYTVGTAANTTANITAKSLTPTATAANKTYDGNTTAVVTVSLGGVISGETVTGTASGTFDTKNIGTGKTVTIGTVTLGGADASNYTAGAAANTTANITAKSLTPTATAANKTYDGSTTAVVTVSLGGVISGETVNGSASGTFDTKNIGTGKTVTVGTVTLGGADAGNYTVGAAANTTANITAKSLTPTATAANKTYDGNTTAVITVSLGGVVSGETVTGTATGTFDTKNVGTGKTVTVGTVTLGGGDAGNYTVGTAANTTANITAKSLTPTATAASKTYDGNTTAAVTVSLGGVLSGETVTGTASGTFDTKNIGTGKTVTVGTVTLGGADAGNYTAGAAANTTADITAKLLTPTATAANKAYDGNTTAVVTVSLGGVVSGETVTGSASGTFDTKNVGIGKTVTVSAVTLGGADAGNYTVGAASNTTANITAKLLTPTATAANKTYDGNTTAVVSISLGGVVSGETVTGSASGTFDTKNVGTGKTVTVGAVTLGGTDAGNYTVGAAANTTANITAKSLTPTATASSKTYDGNTTAVVTVSLGGVLSGETVTGSASGTFDTKNIGTGKTVTVGAVTLGGADAGNYTVGAAANTTADVTAKLLTPTATAANKTYDGNTTAVVTVSLGGVVSGETVTGSASGTFDTKNIGSGKTVTVGSVTLGGADAGNYTVGTAGNTTANITAKSLTPTATAANKTYDGNTSAVVTISLGGVISGETVTGTASGTFDTKNIGTGKTVTVGTVTLGGADAGNYTVATAANAAANITAKSLTPTATAANKTYDGNTTAVVTISLGGVISGETVTGAASGTFDTKNIGTGKTVTVGAVTLGGADAGNYTVGAAASTTANITAKALIGSVTVLDKVFDGNTNATIDTRTLSGVVSGESVTYVGGTTAFPSSAVGTYVLTVTGLSLSGSDAGNYTVNTTANATASITNGPTAPLVSSVVVNGGDTFLNSNQKSIITSFTVNFSTPVTLASGAFILRNIDTNVQVANLVITPNGSSTQFTVRFGSGAGVQTRAGTGSRGNSLLDGNYRLQIDATKVTAGSTAMAADYFFGNNFSDNFFRLFGDADGDGDVDGTDTVAFRRSYLGVENNAAMDFDGDGVTLNDPQDLAGYNANRNKVRIGR